MKVGTIHFALKALSNYLKDWFMNSNTPADPAHSITISHLKRHSRAYDQYSDFRNSNQMINRKNVTLCRFQSSLQTIPVSPDEEGSFPVEW